MNKGQPTNIKFECGEAERGSISYSSIISFKFNGIYYDIEVYVTYSWEQDKEPEYSFLYDCVPDELQDAWNDIKQRLNEEIIRWNESRQ